MRPSLKLVALAGLGLAGIWGIVRTGDAVAQDQAKVARSTRGGLLATTAHHQFEAFFYPTGVRVFARDHSGAAIDATKLDATATFYHPNSPKAWFSRPLRGTGESLDLAIGLENAPRSGAKATFQVSGLPGGDESVATFTVPLEFVPQPTVAQPTAPGAVAPSPRHVYGPGYYGFGYYQYPGPEAAPAHSNGPTVYGYSAPSARSRSGSSGVTHDWSTGRDYPAGGLISKPWLRPMD
jgi:hypothetical protein